MPKFYGFCFFSLAVRWIFLTSSFFFQPQFALIWSVELRTSVWRSRAPSACPPRFCASPPASLPAVKVCYSSSTPSSTLFPCIRCHFRWDTHLIRAFWMLFTPLLRLRLFLYCRRILTCFISLLFQVPRLGIASRCVSTSVWSISSAPTTSSSRSPRSPSSLVSTLRSPSRMTLLTSKCLSERLCLQPLLVSRPRVLRLI